MQSENPIIFEGKTLCFTGTLTTQTRAEASALAKQRGAKVTGEVSSNTSILVIGPTGAGSKVKQAEAKGVEIWTEEQFNEAVGVETTTTTTTTTTTAATKKSPAKKSPAKKSPAKKSPAKKTAKKTKAEEEPDDVPSAKKAKKSPSAKTKNSPNKKKAALAPATPANDELGTRKVMSAVPNADNYRVVGDFDVKLMLSDSLNANSNKFYKLQLLQEEIGDGDFYVATNWGRLGEGGQSQLKGPHGDEETGIQEFSKVFRSKTKNPWGAHPFIRHDDKYQIVETTVGNDGDGGGDAALGRLTENQIHKGQAVLKELRKVLEDKKKKKGDNVVVGRLSNEFYSLIPTTSGRQRPPPLDNLDIVTEKEGLLEFWLRMGFEEVSDANMDGSPIEGVLDLPVPSTLSKAASSITDKYSIKSSRDRAIQLAKSKAGGPKKKMSPELYAAILLYTGNSIYREINRCLRTEWPSVRKYWNYLRLYFEAMDCMPQKEETLWRGIAVDLYDEYEVGKIITWWSISSCTASKSVAQNFMNQLGGGASATMLTLHTKSACDISSLSFYPHEQESLLPPGTRLRVLSRRRNGKIAEIEVEEVVADDES